MQTNRRAVIDVGTNSVKLLVAEVAGHEVRPIREQSHQTRLGAGFYETHRLKAEAIEATAQAVVDFAAMAREAEAGSVRVIATSAAREAVNREELTSAIERTSGLEVEVISGEQEAAWGFAGVTTNPELAQASLLLLDVGGGSTQLVLGRSGQPLLRQSFPLGSVRLLETLPCSDPPQPAELAACRQWLKDFLQKEVRPRLINREGERPREPKHLCESEEIRARGDARPPIKTVVQHAPRSAATELGAGVQLVGVGGTASILGCMELELEAFDRSRIEVARLSAERVLWHLQRLWGLPLEERKKITGLPKNRADVILMGVAIYQAVMEEFGFSELRISTRGLRFAAVLDSERTGKPLE